MFLMTTAGVKVRVPSGSSEAATDVSVSRCPGSGCYRPHDTGHSKGLARRALRELVAVTARLPDEVLDRMVVVGWTLDRNRPLSALWWVVDHGPDVQWDELMDDADAELVARLEERINTGLGAWRGSDEEVSALMTVIVL